MSSFVGKAVVSAYRGGNFISGKVPTAIGNPIVKTLATATARVPSSRRTIVGRNIDRVVGTNIDAETRGRLIDATFQSYARYYYDSFRLTTMTPQQVDDGFTVEGLEHIEHALEHDDVGPILALPHLGGWEWAAYWIAQVKRWKIAAVVEELSPKELFDWFMEFRQSLGLNMISVGPSAVEQITMAIADKNIMCLLCDRDITGGGVDVEFFGERTTLPAGPAVIALRGGSAILPTAVYFSDQGVHSIVRPPLEVVKDPSTDSIRGDVARITQALAYELEDLIRRAPTEWHLMQPNWPSDDELLKD